MEILTFRKILKIYCKSSFKYLAIKNIVGDSKVELGVILKAKSSSKIENLSNLSISLLIGKEIQKIAVYKAKNLWKEL